MPPSSPRGNKIVKLKAYRRSDLKEFPNKHSFLTTNDVGSQENPIGPKQSRVFGWQSEGEWGSQWVRDRFRMRAKATGVPFLTSLKCHHTMMIWIPWNQSWGENQHKQRKNSESQIIGPLQSRPTTGVTQQWQHPWGGRRVYLLTTVFVLG